MIYSLLFMTDYTGSIKAYAPDRQNFNYIRFDKFGSLFYIVHDGERINQTTNYLVKEEGGIHKFLYCPERFCSH